jgi:hypothetical protein
MPTRAVRIHIRNHTAAFSLDQIANRNCSGNWTASWAPVGSISPGGIGALQSEADGVLGSNAGWVKYGVTDNSGPLPKTVGMFYIYWDNPFNDVDVLNFKLQFPKCRVVANPNDVAVDCGDDPSHAGFGGAGGVSPLPFHVVPTGGVAPKDRQKIKPNDFEDMVITGSEGNDNPSIDVDLYGQLPTIVPAAIVEVVGALFSGNFTTDAGNAILPNSSHSFLVDVFDGIGTPLVGGATADSFTVIGSPTAKQWTGQWIGDGISIQISSSGAVSTSINLSLDVKITDNRNPHLSLEQQVLLGEFTKLRQPVPAPVTKPGTHLGPVAAHLPLAVTGVTGGLSGPGLAHLPAVEPTPTYVNGIITLPSGIKLQLFQRHNNNVVTGTAMQYRRPGQPGLMLAHRDNSIK